MSNGDCADPWMHYCDMTDEKNQKKHAYIVEK